MRILIAEAKQEISSFNPVPSRYGDFKVRHGSDMLVASRGTKGEIAGALSVFDARNDVTIVPSYSATSITSGGLLAADDFARIAREFMAAIEAAPAVEGAYFSMHGAMAAESEFDVEGYLLEQARRSLGEKVPIVVSLDLHGVLTDRMLQQADAVVSYQTYPHVDFFSTGQRAARVLMRILDYAARPVTAKIDVPALVRGDELITESGVIRHAIDAAKRAECSEHGLSAGLFWSNPFTDVPGLMSSAFVVTDGDPMGAENGARQIADLFWRHHEQMQVPLISLQDAIAQAKQVMSSGRGGTVILVDAADATSSGASGDSNALLRAAVEGGYEGSILIPIVDAPAVAAAFSAGVGGSIRVNVGGDLDRARFRPLPIEGHVHMLSEGSFRSETTREWWNSGRTAVVRWRTATIILMSRPCHLFDRALFYAHGQNPRDFDAVVVKSPNCEPHMFRNWAAKYLDVDTPGSTSANLRSLGHRLCPRPMFPLDENVRFEPRLKLFRR